jgi:hypothetical protein
MQTYSMIVNELILINYLMNWVGIVNRQRNDCRKNASGTYKLMITSGKASKILGFNAEINRPKLFFKSKTLSLNFEI